MTTLNVLTFNLSNPGRSLAARQLAYLAARPESVLVLTGTAHSAGCDLIAGRFRAAGYHVVYPRPERGERGVMVVSRLAVRLRIATTPYLPHRCVWVTVDTDTEPVDIIGLYVPLRGLTDWEMARKKAFLQGATEALPYGSDGGHRLVTGDLNLLEPGHIPRYQFFEKFEYDFYRWLMKVGYVDAFRALRPTAREYSWFGRLGDGFRYDHAHVSRALAPALRSCIYVHGVRTDHKPQVTDHSALTVSLAVRLSAPLSVTSPEFVPGLATRSVLSTDEEDEDDENHE